MSQAKVDKYKQEKANRKKNIRAQRLLQGIFIAGDTEQQLKAVLLALGAKAIEIMRILADTLVYIELGAFSNLDACERVQAHVERIADAAALEHGQIRFYIGNYSVYVVEHGSNLSC